MSKVNATCSDLRPIFMSLGTEVPYSKTMCIKSYMDTFCMIQGKVKCYRFRSTQSCYANICIFNLYGNTNYKMTRQTQIRIISNFNFTTNCEGYLQDT